MPHISTVPSLIPRPPTPSQLLDLFFSYYCYTYNVTLRSQEILNENFQHQPCVSHHELLVR